jgi:hypothetical protein
LLFLPPPHSTQDGIGTLLDTQQCFCLGQSDAELRADMDAFQTLFSTVMGMQLRDQIFQKMRTARQNADQTNINGNAATAMQKCQNKLLALAHPFRPAECHFVVVDHRNMEMENTIRLLNGRGEKKLQQQPLIWPSLKRWACQKNSMPQKKCKKKIAKIF